MLKLIFVFQKFDKLNVKFVTSKVPPYEICGIIGHVGVESKRISNREFVLHDVKCFINSQRGSLYSNMYNSESGDLPSFS